VTKLGLIVDYGTKAKTRMVEVQTWTYTWVSDYHLMGTWGCPIFHREDNYRFVDNPTQAIWLPINKTWARNWSTMSSLGYQPCATRLTLTWRLSPTYESKNTSKRKEEHNSIAEILELSTRMWGFKNRWRRNCSWQIILSTTQTLTWANLLNIKCLGCARPLDAPSNGLQYDTRANGRKDSGAAPLQIVDVLLFWRFPLTQTW
jgi:hypothetical protein